MSDIHQLHFHNESPLIPGISADAEVKDGFLMLEPLFMANREGKEE